MRLKLFVTLLALALWPGVATARDQAIDAFFAKYSVPVPTRQEVLVCHGFGCKYRTRVALTDRDIRALSRIVAKGRASAAAEVRAIAEAVAWFERRIGPIAGTAQRTPRAGPSRSGIRGEADCIDETINTTSVLVLLTDLQLLRHHRVAEPEARGFLLDGRYPHATAVIENAHTGARVAIDPWTRRNGERPETMPIEQWLAAGG